MANKTTEKWKKLGTNRFVSAIKNSKQGLVAAYQTEAAFRQELVLVIPLIVAAFFVGNNPTQVVLLIMVCVMVLLVEIINSAIEAVVDRIGLEHHELSGKAKDLGSLAVMLTIVLAIGVWSIIIVGNAL